MIKKMLLLSALVLAALGASPAYAQYNNQNFITCTPTSLPAGGTVTCTSGYFDPGTSVVWTLDGTQTGSTLADASGRASISFQVPAGYQLGAHTVAATGTALGSRVSLTLTASITVTGAGTATTTPASTGTLPTTGSSSTGTLLIGGAALIALGGFFVLSTRKQRERSTIDA